MNLLSASCQGTSGTTGYDNAGNVTAYNNYYNGVATHYYAYDDDGQITSINNGNTTYTYDASGNRVRKDSNGTWTEYISFGGQTVAEKNSNGKWSDYIYANGQRIAKSEMTQSVDVRFTNDSCSGCSGTPVGGGDRNLFINSITIGSTTIQQSDPAVSFVGAPCNFYSGSLAVLPCNGDWVDSQTPAGDTITISAWGSPDYNVYPHMQVYVNGELAGEWDVTGQAQNYTVSSTHFYTSDQIGSTRMETDGSGNVVSMNEFYPYGQGPQPTSQDHYLFSGKERDSESGLDYFGARYYAGGLGRFMSADWSAQVEPVPYAKLEEPQTLNLYAYVRNNPISLVDPDGHWIRPDGGCCFQLYYPEDATNMGTNERNKAKKAQEEAQQQNDKNTDVMMMANSGAGPSANPHPSSHGMDGTAYMDWAIVPQADNISQLSSASIKAAQDKYSKASILLDESKPGGKEHWEGSDTGKGHDNINPMALPVTQKWYINTGGGNNSGNQRIQLVIGMKPDGTLIKAWTVQVTAGPVYKKED